MKKYVDQFEPWMPGTDVTIVGLEGRSIKERSSILYAYPATPTTQMKANSFSGMKERITITDRFILKCLKL